MVGILAASNGMVSSIFAPVVVSVCVCVCVCVCVRVRERGCVCVQERPTSLGMNGHDYKSWERFLARMEFLRALVEGSTAAPWDGAVVCVLRGRYCICSDVHLSCSFSETTHSFTDILSKLQNTQLGSRVCVCVCLCVWVYMC